MAAREDYAEELEGWAARLSPITDAAIAAGAMAALADPTFPRLPLEEAAAAVLVAVGGAAVSAVPPVLLAVALSALRRGGGTSDIGGAASLAAARYGAQTGLENLARVAQGAGRRALAADPPVKPTWRPSGPRSLDPFRPGPVVARGIATTTVNAAWYQAGIDSGHTHRTWHSVRDDRVRPTHAVLDSHAWPEHTVPIMEPFRSPSGAAIRFPGDPLAPYEEVISCRCHLTYSTPKRGKAYGEAADLATNPPEMGQPFAPEGG